jgi:hyperosmotically inducible periplasmic protein
MGIVIRPFVIVLITDFSFYSVSRCQGVDSYRAGRRASVRSFCISFAVGELLRSSEKRLVKTITGETMKPKLVLLVFLLALGINLAVSAQTLGKGHSDSAAVKRALEQADLKGLNVSEDTSKNTMTLSGTLHSEQAKERAGRIAQSTAPGRQIANEISVEPVGHESQARRVSSSLDDGIENNYKAQLAGSGLDKESIHYKVKNRVMTLTGSVKSNEQRQHAAELASKVPNVRQVINQLEVRR